MATMSFFLLLFYLSLFSVLGLETDDCKPTRCKKHGPKIQFPFRIKERSPEYCGYRGFEVFCDEKHETMLLLPSSVQVVVKDIDYVTQQIHLYDPENCFPRKLPQLNLSSSPFFPDYYRNYTLFNCSAPFERNCGIPIPCLDDSRYHIFVVDSYEMGYCPLASCTQIHEYSLPLYPFSYSMSGENSLYLNWLEPACGICEAQGQRCKLSTNSTITHQIQCVDIDKPKTNSKQVILLFPSFCHACFLRLCLRPFPFYSGYRLQGASNGPLLGGALGTCLVVTILAALILLYISITSDRENHIKIEKFLEDYRALKPTRFSYSDITRITRKFSEKLGEGGYGTVYKAKLSTQIHAAVKLLHNSKGNGEEFVNEVSTIGRIHHVNIVRLIGFCAEGSKRALVYEFLPNDSLEKFIFRSSSSRPSLGWPKLRDIALGIARGIEYLHFGCDHQILHFDIKPHNILLDRNFGPKICDFGLAKLCSKEQSGVTMTAARGTMGYIAPEVLSRTFGRASYKSDVYSFGMMVLEMVGGRKNMDPNLDTSQVYFPQWVYNRLDSDFGEDFWAGVEEGEDGNVARRLTIVGLWCVQWSPNDRPSMKEVVAMLEGSEESLVIPPNPFADNNARTSVARVISGRWQQHHRIELGTVQETEYFSA
ncbi:receptor serine/threonine kinase [Striga asiatica]|uniref:Receptor serine/threonine kinase n=1 Tax=Striga asiatica TaxID=4170 RepID=A0A5A7QM34_STRAF|nr:receptor serine/threonine kinase [Striga asiatica]